MKECVAMLLAGGQGSRLYTLTKNLAKPAVPFGGKYRIVDFPLSNCVNSDIDTVGILTQYLPMVLNDYIGNGQPWDLDRSYGGVHILPPYQKASGSDWYRGTANAIYQNINFIERYNPKYVLILSGDHIYKMNYGKMLQYHKEKGADCTIAVMDVPPAETHRFGIMTANAEHLITKFEEKPKKTESTLASMGIYIFTWSKLKEVLENDENDNTSDNDFGKNIIPKMLDVKQNLFAYPFEGYWKDVGTIESLWEANMDLLDPKQPLDMRDKTWKIYSRTAGRPPHRVGISANVENAMITEGCIVDGEVESSILFAGVQIEAGAVVRDSVLMPGAIVKSGAQVSYSIIAEDAVIEKGAVVGMRPEHMDDISKWGISVVGESVVIGAGALISPKSMVENNVEAGTTV